MYLSTGDVAGLQHALFRDSCRVSRVYSRIPGSYRISFWLYVASWYDSVCVCVCVCVIVEVFTEQGVLARHTPYWDRCCQEAQQVCEVGRWGVVRHGDGRDRWRRCLLSWCALNAQLTVTQRVATEGRSQRDRDHAVTMPHCRLSTQPHHSQVSSPLTFASSQSLAELFSTLKTCS